jgi:hypothetical protein
MLLQEVLNYDDRMGREIVQKEPTAVLSKLLPHS